MSALSGIRLVDLSGTVATSYCGKLFASFGADVINVERPRSGNPTRRLPPFAPDAAAPESSALAAYLDAGKRSLVLDLDCAEDRDRALALCAAADIVLEAERPGLLAAKGIDPQTIAAAGGTPLLGGTPLMASLTWFGQSGPWSQLHASDATIHALIGQVRGFGPSAGPPLAPSGHEIQTIGGLTAFVALLGQLIGRQRGTLRGPGHVDVSLYEASLCLVEPGAVSSHNLDEDPRPRLGLNRYWPTFPAGIYPCRDGWIGVTALLPTQWRTFCELIGAPELADEPRFALHADRHEAADELDEIFSEKLRARDAAYWFHEGQKRRLPLAMVPTMADLLACKQFTERDAFEPIEHPTLGRYVGPGVPFHPSRTPAVPRGPAPTLGEHDTEPEQEARSSPPPAGGPEVGRAATTPLHGLRVVDLSMGWAGPLAARHLADMGAQVVKVESCRHFDWWRGWEVTEEVLADNGLEKSWAYHTVNRNKLDVTLDLTEEAGTDLLKRLVGTADAVIENFAGSVLPKLGLGYPVLETCRENIVMLSMPPFGATGDWRGYRAYGSTVEQASGLPHLQGYADWPPLMQHVALGDPIAGLNGAAAVLVGLFHQARRGEGQFIDLSHVECLFPFAAEGLIEQSLGGTPARHGRRHPLFAPHGVYPCLGDDRWIVISVDTDHAWQSLRALVPGLDELHLPTPRERQHHHDEIDRRLSAWTALGNDHDLMSQLDGAGVAAGVVRHAGELLEDPQLAERGFWQWAHGEIVGRQPNPSAPYRIDGRHPVVLSQAPTLGAHNREVLQGMLGLTDEEIAGLETEGIIGTRPVA